MVEWLIHQVERDRDVSFEPDAVLAAQYASVSGAGYIVNRIRQEIESPQEFVEEAWFIEDRLREEFPIYAELHDALGLPEVENETPIRGLENFINVFARNNNMRFSMEATFHLSRLTTSGLRVLLYQSAEESEIRFIDLHDINSASERVFDAGLLIDWS